eukprot:8096514-Alexandrium_andersonii.AAC.1
MHRPQTGPAKTRVPDKNVCAPMTCIASTMGRRSMELQKYVCRACTARRGNPDCTTTLGLDFERRAHFDQTP